MADFQPAYQKLRNLEGYFLRDKDGETYAGILRRYWPEWRGWFFIDQYPNLTNGQKCPNDRIENLIEVFYLDEFWNRQPFEQINDQQTATAIFCQYVNSGSEAIIVAQRAAGVTDDGIMGNITLTAINAANPQTYLAAFKDEYIKFYNDVAINEPQKKNDLKGWLNRINQLC